MMIRLKLIIFTVWVQHSPFQRFVDLFCLIGHFVVIFVAFSLSLQLQFLLFLLEFRPIGLLGARLFFIIFLLFYRSTTTTTGTEFRTRTQMRLSFAFAEFVIAWALLPRLSTSTSWNIAGCVCVSVDMKSHHYHSRITWFAKWFPPIGTLSIVSFERWTLRIRAMSIVSFKLWLLFQLHLLHITVRRRFCGSFLCGYHRWNWFDFDFIETSHSVVLCGRRIVCVWQKTHARVLYYVFGVSVNT